MWAPSAGRPWLISALGKAGIGEDGPAGSWVPNHMGLYRLRPFEIKKPFLKLTILLISSGMGHCIGQQIS